MPEFEIRVSDQFLEAAVLAGVEAYHLGDGRKRQRGHPAVETIGNVWGVSLLKPDGVRLLHLERFTLTQAAKRTPDSVLPNPHARKLAMEVVRRWSPHLRLLGDLHTHPYSNLSSVQQENGFEFSPDDFSCFKEDDVAWESAEGFPVMLALTICRLERVRETGLQCVRSNLWRFDVGQFRLWLNVSVGWKDADERNYTGNTYSSAKLVPPMHYNTRRHRIQFDNKE